MADREQEARADTRARNLRENNGMKDVFNEKATPPAAKYSQAIKAGGVIYVSGQIPFTNENPANPIKVGHKFGEKSDETAPEERRIPFLTKQCCDNIQAILKEAGSSMHRVVKVNVFLDDMGHYKEMNDIFCVRFPHRPARSCVAVKTLPKNVKVEIECIALEGRDAKNADAEEKADLEAEKEVLDKVPEQN